MARQLTKLDPTEISLVPSGANKKRMLVFKEGGDRFLEKILKSFGKKDDDDSINDSLDGLSPSAQTAARAIGRIAAPHADELKASHLGAVLSQAGIDGVGGKSGGSQMSAKVKDEDKKKAKEAGEKAYKAQMEKMGYQKYPTGELTMKDDSEDDEDEEEKEKLRKAAAKKDEEEAAEKARKEKVKMDVSKIFKEDGTIDVTGVDKEKNPELFLIAKMFQDSNARVLAAEKRAESAERITKEQQVAVRKSEIVRKSGEFKHLSQPYCQEVLELADKAGAEQYEKICKSLEAQNAQMGQSGLFGEIGRTGGMSENGIDAWSKIEKAAETIVQKSGEKGVTITKEMAQADFLETAEGQKLYAQHQASRPNGI